MARRTAGISRIEAERGGGLYAEFTCSGFFLLACRRSQRLAGFITATSLRKWHLALRVLIGSVWVFHGLYSKLFNGIPRHQAILGKVLGVGDDISRPAILLIGVMEVSLGIWAWSGRFPRSCALTQTLAIIGMNTLEICFAKDLLISAPGMVALNLGFLSLGWYQAMVLSQRRETSGAVAESAA
ncbi:MAG: hypothetical protein JWO82_59 [Akkermansiaceae bacterium]|nr:hypothetical protein [Akkermansiaceae bacterium]